MKQRHKGTTLFIPTHPFILMLSSEQSYMHLLGPLFEAKLEKIKKSTPQKKYYISGNRTFLPQKLNKTFLYS